MSAVQVVERIRAVSAAQLALIYGGVRAYELPLLRSRRIARH